MKYIKDLTITIIAAIIIMLTIIGLCSLFKKKDNTTPVEEMIAVDSLIKTNDSIKLKVESLDSIKNAKIIEISNLDNDSTIKLFYKLVSE